ncbi:MAG: cofactor-independent phosphoglycerate mutase [Oscillospiraceae bacterium]|nr:cofactor-independent phosphoglycerate mutase [Oscillospiraceae bacterium]
MLNNKQKKQKIAVIIPDGMADLKIPELNNKTPMQSANKPCMDFLALNGVCGMVECIPGGMISDASATANLSILGYDPEIYSRGRSPLEAASIGLELRLNDTALRCNLVTLSEEEPYEEKTIIDHSADEIETPESSGLISVLNQELGTDKIRFHTGISYRHCLLWEDYENNFKFTGPHDILNKKIKGYLPAGECLELMKKSFDILKNHGINKKRIENSKRPANSIWLWSPGTKPALPDFRTKRGLDGSVIAAVDLIKGIGIYAGMNVVNVEGATGNFHTNYKNKGLAAIKEFENGSDFVFIHVEAPDECGHRGEIQNKVKSIENIDDMIIKPVYDYLNSKFEDFKILILPDHPTYLSTGAHSYNPAPFLIYKKNSGINSGISNFNEESVSEKSGVYIKDGYKLLDFVLDN